MSAKYSSILLMGDNHKKRAQSRQQCWPVPTLIKRSASRKGPHHTEQPTWCSKSNEDKVIRRSGPNTEVKVWHTDFQCKQSDSSRMRLWTSLWQDCNQFLIYLLRFSLRTQTQTMFISKQLIDHNVVWFDPTHPRKHGECGKQVSRKEIWVRSERLNLMESILDVHQSTPPQKT